MPKSIRKQRQEAAAAAGQAPDLVKYKIADAAFMPDAYGKLAGGTVFYENTDRFVYLSEDAARFYVDNGGLVPADVA